MLVHESHVWIMYNFDINNVIEQCVMCHHKLMNELRKNVQR